MQVTQGNTVLFASPYRSYINYVLSTVITLVQTLVRFRGRIGWSRTLILHPTSTFTVVTSATLEDAIGSPKIRRVHSDWKLPFKLCARSVM